MAGLVYVHRRPGSVAGVPAARHYPYARASVAICAWPFGGSGPVLLVPASWSAVELAHHDTGDVGDRASCGLGCWCRPQVDRGSAGTLGG